MPLEPQTLQFVRDFAAKEAKILIAPEKAALVQARLGRVARRHRFETVEALVAELRKPVRSPELVADCIDALTTHETSFFRDHHPFEAVRTSILPQLIRSRAREKRLRLWSAAASTGQEAYSLAVIVAECFPMLRDWDVRILGTDLSANAVARARHGRYRADEVNRGLPARLLVKHFRQEGEDWVVKEEVRRLTEFRRMNLLDPWPVTGRFDIVFIRNVLIYFDLASKAHLFRRMHQAVAPDGVLVLGTAETPLNLDAGWVSERHGVISVYRQGEAGGPHARQAA